MQCSVLGRQRPWCPEDQACAVLHSFLASLENCGTSQDLSTSEQRAHTALRGTIQQLIYLIENHKQHLLPTRFKQPFRTCPTTQVEDCLAELERALPELHHAVCSTAQPREFSPFHPQREDTVAPCRRSPKDKSLLHHNVGTHHFDICSRSYGKTTISGKAQVVQGDIHQSFIFNETRCVVLTASCIKHV